jgi:hypothetical protein
MDPICDCSSLDILSIFAYNEIQVMAKDIWRYWITQTGRIKFIRKFLNEIAEQKPEIRDIACSSVCERVYEKLYWSWDKNIEVKLKFNKKIICSHFLKNFLNILFPNNIFFCWDIHLKLFQNKTSFNPKISDESKFY